MRASFTIPSQSEGFLETSTTVSVLPPTIPCSLRALFTPPSHLNSSLTLPSWSEHSLCTSPIVWWLPSHFLHGLTASLAITRLSDDFPSASPALLSWTKDFSLTALIVWGLSSYFPHSLRASLTTYGHSWPTLPSVGCHHNSLAYWQLTSNFPHTLGASLAVWWRTCNFSAFLQFPYTLGTSLTYLLQFIIPMHSGGFPCNSFPLWGLPSHFPCTLGNSLMLTLQYESFPHNSITVWGLP